MFSKKSSKNTSSYSWSKTFRRHFSSTCKTCSMSGVILIVCGVFFHFFWNDIIRYIISKEFRLSQASKSYSFWLENPMPLHIDFYFFNWTNPYDLKKGQKPEFQELGPYRFRENIKKVELTWNDNGTVSYKKMRRWYFDKAGTKGSLDDHITTLNVVSLTAVRTTRYWSKMLRLPMSAVLSSTQKIHLTRKVREFLFEGFSDPLVEFASNVPSLKSLVPFDKFGWFYKRNGTSDFDGVFNVETGANGMENFGQIKFWNFNNRTSFYKDHCGEVFGSAGDFWPPGKPANEDIVLFSPDMCRYIAFRYSGNTSVGGVQGYQYRSGRELFDNGTLDPRNECFCNGDCYPSGVVNVSSCRFGAPAFVSYPHFYLGDPSYLEPISGMKPNSSKHDMYITLEQTWRIPLEVAVRLQINVHLESDPGIRMYRDVPNIFFPVMWFEQKVTMPETMRSEIAFLLQLPSYRIFVSAALYSAGIFFIAVSVVFTLRKMP